LKKKIKTFQTKLNQIGKWKESEGNEQNEVKKNNIDLFGVSSIPFNKQSHILTFDASLSLQSQHEHTEYGQAEHGSAEEDFDEEFLNGALEQSQIDQTNPEESIKQREDQTTNFSKVIENYGEEEGLLTEQSQRDILMEPNPKESIKSQPKDQTINFTQVLDNFDDDDDYEKLLADISDQIGEDLENDDNDANENSKTNQHNIGSSPKPKEIEMEVEKKTSQKENEKEKEKEKEDVNVNENENGSSSQHKASPLRPDMNESLKQLEQSDSEDVCHFDFGEEDNQNDKTKSFELPNVTDGAFLDNEESPF